MSKKLKNYLKLIAKLAVTGAALYYVYTKINIVETWGIIKSANILFLLGAVFMFIISKVISSVRLNRYFKNISINLSEKQNLQLYWLGMFYNLSLPGGIGGDGYKVYLLNKKFEVKALDIFWAVLLDRVIGVLALFCLSVILLFFVPVTFPYKTLTLLAVPVSIGVAWWVYKIFFEKHKKIFVITNLQSILVQLLQLICAWLILLSLKETDQILSYMLVFLVSSIVAILPLTIGGAGAREVTFLFGSQLLGLNVNVSIVLSILFYAITVVVSLWGLFYILKPIRL